MCRDIKSIQPIDVAHVIIDRLTNVSRHVTIQNIYIAYPSNAKQFVDDSIEALRKSYVSSMIHYSLNVL